MLFSENLAAEIFKDLAVHAICDLKYWLFLDRIADLDILEVTYRLSKFFIVEPVPPCNASQFDTDQPYQNGTHCRIDKASDGIVSKDPSPPLPLASAFNLFPNLTILSTQFDMVFGKSWTRGDLLMTFVACHFNDVRLRGLWMQCKSSSATA